MAYQERDPKRDASEILTASKSLRRALSKLSAGEAGRTNVTVELIERPDVKDTKGDGEPTANVGPHDLRVRIEGEVSHVEALGDQFTDAGCTCVSVESSDPNDPNLAAQECDCSNLPE